MADKAPEVTPTPEVKELTINLKYALTTNGVVQGPGKVTVSEDIAEDLLRREAEWDKYERERLSSKEVVLDISAITGQVLSGAGMEVPAE